MTFEDISQLMEKLEQTISVYRSELGDLGAKSEMLTNFELKLNEKSTLIDGKVKELNSVSERQKEEREYIDRIRAEQNTREEFIKEETKKLEETRLAIEAKKVTLDAQESKIKASIDTLKGLQEKEKELQDRETILTREKTIDGERKQILDLREKKLEKEQTRLQRISESLS